MLDVTVIAGSATGGPYVKAVLQIDRGCREMVDPVEIDGWVDKTKAMYRGANPDVTTLPSIVVMIDEVTG